MTGDPDPALDDCGADAGGTVTGKNTVEMQGRNIGDVLNLNGVTWGWFEGGFARTSAPVLNTDGSTLTPATCSDRAHRAPVRHAAGSDGAESARSTRVRIFTCRRSTIRRITRRSSTTPSTRNPHHIPPASVAEIGHNGPANHQYDLNDFWPR